MLHTLLIEEAQGWVLQGQEEVIVFIEAIGIAGEGVHKQLQLIIGWLTWSYAYLKEFGL